MLNRVFAAGKICHNHEPYHGQRCSRQSSCRSSIPAALGTVYSWARPCLFWLESRVARHLPRIRRQPNLQSNPKGALPVSKNPNSHPPVFYHHIVEQLYDHGLRFLHDTGAGPFIMQSCGFTKLETAQVLLSQNALNAAAIPLLTTFGKKKPALANALSFSHPPEDLARVCCSCWPVLVLARRDSCSPACSWLQAHRRGHLRLRAISYLFSQRSLRYGHWHQKYDLASSRGRAGLCVRPRF